MKNFKLCFTLILSVLVIQISCGRWGGRSSGSGRSSGGRSSSSSSHSSRSYSHSPSRSPSYSPSHSPSYSPSHSPSYSRPPAYSPSYHPSYSPSHYPPHSPSHYPSPPSHYTTTHISSPGTHNNPGSRPSIGLDIVNRMTNRHAVGLPAYKPGIGFENIHHQTNTNPLGNHNPSAPVAPHHVPVGPPVQKPGIGFENVNRPAGVPSGKPHDIGFENVHNRLASNPSAPHPPPLNAPGNQGSRPYPVQPPSVHQPYHPPAIHHPPAIQRPYQPQTVVHTNGHVVYHPPVQPQYRPPVVTSTTFIHHVPVYTPVYTPVVHSYSSGHTSSFLGGYLIGQMSSHSHHHHHYHTSNNVNSNNNNANTYRSEDAYYREERPGTPPVIYTVHHYYQNPEKVPQKFEIVGDNLISCNSNTSDTFCAPNTNALCLKNGTVMCTTPLNFTSPCNNTMKTACVYTRIDCAGRPPCNVAENQTFIDYFVPCISNITLTYRVDYSSGSFLNTPTTYDLCVTAMAVKQTVSSPVGDLVKFVTQLTAYHAKNLMEITKTSNNTIKPL